MSIIAVSPAGTDLRETQPRPFGILVYRGPGRSNVSLPYVGERARVRIPTVRVGSNALLGELSGRPLARRILATRCQPDAGSGSGRADVRHQPGDRSGRGNAQRPRVRGWDHPARRGRWG